MMSEPDKKGIRKVYIEDPEVVSCDESCISVQFLQTSYVVRVETGSEPLVLGPVEVGHIDKQSSSWRLSQGKRLTLVIHKALDTKAIDQRYYKNREEALRAENEKEVATKADEKAEGGDSMWGIVGMLLSFVPVLFSFYYFNIYKAQGGGSSGK